MIQIELYVDGVEEVARLFTDVFGFDEIQNKAGWCNVEYKGLYQIMLYDPRRNGEHRDEWFLPSHDGKAGQGVQIVIGVDDAARTRDETMRMGYACSDLHTAPWGTLEYTFTLKEGYFIRIKQALAA